MIYPLSGLVIGAILGAFSAKRRGGKTLDLLQWGGVLAIMGAILGMFALVMIERASI
ncbi:hypothetical protein FHS72_001635 [Loktanella ponticola]|uniref:Apolipoprotein acyltransferase n=1 Tax=Yoonia ponticola TaxID=1524255 RepID=A0A7W9BKH5_9RHOB|nr:hypothetical protein [Yoonia ponticola]MBB5722011.1 hypothetical protein [Yoonia ponticola]